MAVFVLDRRGTPLMPCTEKRARLLLERGRACVHLVMPFTIRIVDLKAENCAFQALRVKLKSTENQREYVLDALERIVSIVPWQCDGGGFVFDHYYHEGEYIDAENVDPTWVVFEMVEVATHTIATVEGVQ
jgi:hypothetical protein